MEITRIQKQFLVKAEDVIQLGKQDLQSNGFSNNPKKAELNQGRKSMKKGQKPNVQSKDRLKQKYKEKVGGGSGGRTS